MTVSNMSKVSRDADWSLCWEVWRGLTDKMIEYMRISDLKAEDFSIPEEDKGYALEDSMTHACFGGIILADKVWVRKREGEGYLEINGKRVWEWKGFPIP
jgi:hypothetical protein